MIPSSEMYGQRSWWSTCIVVTTLWGQHGCSFQPVIPRRGNHPVIGRRPSFDSWQQAAAQPWHSQNVLPLASHYRSDQCGGEAPMLNKKGYIRRILGSIMDVLQPAGFVTSLSDSHGKETIATRQSMMMDASMVVHTAGPLRFIPKRIKKLHDPITYFLLGLIAGFRYTWCFESPLYYFAMGFCIKWYRARYVFRIPVWDRQPNWNNVITNKSQEKDLKAVTCKNCGTTLFIAKTREFFFEGDTGISGLGCFHCGAKGKDNFVYDRDRILEDVGDMDDYFEYERPLDFVSRAERRKLLKEAEGDENKANQLLMERNNKNEGSTTMTATANGSAQPSEYIDAVVENPKDVVADANGSNQDALAKKKKKKKKKSAEPLPELEIVEKKNDSVALLPVDEQPLPSVKPAVSLSSSDDDLSALDMDAW